MHHVSNSCYVRGSDVAQCSRYTRYCLFIFEELLFNSRVSILVISAYSEFMEITKIAKVMEVNMKKNKAIINLVNS
jgi:hypothetical protein